MDSQSTVSEAKVCPRPWSEADDELLRRQYQQRRPVADIARQLGRTESAVRTRLSLLGAHRRRAWTTKEQAALRDMAGELTIEELARHLRRSPNAVAKRLHQLGIAHKGTRYSDEEVRLDLLAFLVGREPNETSTATVAYHFGWSLPLARRRLQMLLDARQVVRRQRRSAWLYRVTKRGKSALAVDGTAPAE